MMLSAELGTWGPGHPAVGQVVANRRLTARGHFQDVRHVEVALGPGGPAFQPGDALALPPQQPPQAVHAFLRICGVRPCDILTLQLSDSPPGAPSYERAGVQVRACGLPPAACMPALFPHLYASSIPCHLAFLAALAQSKH